MVTIEYQCSRCGEVSKRKATTSRKARESNSMVNMAKKADKAQKAESKFQETLNSVRVVLEKSNGIERCRELIATFSGQRSLEPREENSIARQICVRLQLCHSVGNSINLRLKVEQLFYYACLAAEWQKLSSYEDSAAAKKLRRNLKDELFPHINATRFPGNWLEKRTKKLEYYVKIGKVTLEAIRNFGCGALVHPLSEIAIKSIQNVQHDQISRLMEVMATPSINLQSNLAEFSPALCSLMIGRIDLSHVIVQKEESQCQRPTDLLTFTASKTRIDAENLVLELFSAAPTRSDKTTRDMLDRCSIEVAALGPESNVVISDRNDDHNDLNDGNLFDWWLNQGMSAAEFIGKYQDIDSDTLTDGQTEARHETSPLSSDLTDGLELLDLQDS